ncbi:MAG: class E sortase [Acidimicrobiia bacterium]|nr:class E sortase [Acidimicrobiia bacterium]
MARRVGWALLAVGVLLGAFVGYELWVTSLVARHGQAGLQAELEERSAAAVPAVVRYEADTGRAVSPLSLPAGLPGPGEIDLAAALASAGLPPASSPPPGVGEGDLVSEEPPPEGGPVGRIVIPAAGVDWTVVEGVSAADLRRGAGHMPATALPGQPGNAVISGHRTTYGAPFHHLDRVAPGDLITVTTVTGTHAYQVVHVMVVRPSEVWVTEQWQGSWLTLTTCHPRFSARQRLVVVARLIGGPNAPALVAGAV